MSKPWLKLWVEWIHDPKVLNLSLAEKGAWVALLTLAQECDADGHLVMGNSVPMTLAEIATSLHITKKRELDELSSMIEKMERYGSISQNSIGLLITNFKERQNTAPSETKEAMRERKRRQREKLKEQPPPPPNSPTNKNIEGEGEGEGHDRDIVTTKPLFDSESHDKTVTKELKTSQKLSKNIKEPPKAMVPAMTFGEYTNYLSLEYPELNVEKEWEACQVWWEEHKKQIKAPKSALRNWLVRAKELKTQYGGNIHGNAKNLSSNAFHKPQPASPPPTYIDGDAEATAENTGTNL